jgi:predicted DCC family thiol-disulfide oxidoreductase YuxK
LDSPERRIVVYDGQCHLCSRWVGFFQRHPVTPSFRLLPMQTAAGRAILIQNGVDPDDPTTFLVLDGGRVRTASDATIHLMTSPGGTWKLLHLARLIPRSWRDWIYGVVARNRYGWFGRRDTCDLPKSPPS